MVFVLLQFLETSLGRFLGVDGLSLCASTVPETFNDPAEVTYLSLADCALPGVPDKIGSVSSLFLFFFLLFVLFQSFVHTSFFSLFSFFAASFVNLTELDLSWNKQLVALPVWLQRGLPHLTKLSLRGCGNSLDFGALSSFLNLSVVTKLDLSSCHWLMASPGVVSAFIRDTKTLKHLRSELNNKTNNVLERMNQKLMFPFDSIN